MYVQVFAVITLSIGNSSNASGASAPAAFSETMIDKALAARVVSDLIQNPSRLKSSSVFGASLEAVRSTAANIPEYATRVLPAE